jgi:hypothetical protein
MCGNPDYIMILPAYGRNPRLSSVIGRVKGKPKNNSLLLGQREERGRRRNCILLLAGHGRESRI